MKPLIKWAGGKSWLVPRMLELYNSVSSDRIVEPFCGGCSITFGIEPPKALCADVNPVLIEMYKAFSQKWFVLSDKVDFTNTAEVYYKNRERFNDLSEWFGDIRMSESQKNEIITLFLYLNKTGFQGLYRVNKQGYLNVPYGHYKKLEYRKDFSEYEEKLPNYLFAVADYRHTITHLKENDFVYADPPYDTTFDSYTSGGFSFHDQTILATGLALHTGPVVISNQGTPKMVDLYRSLGYTVETFFTQRKLRVQVGQAASPELLAMRNL